MSLLLLRANQTVTAQAIKEELWMDAPVHSANTTMQTYIYQLRKALGADRLVSCRPGYRLLVREHESDLLVFGRLARMGQAAYERRNLEEAADVLRAATALWRGTALANVEHGPLIQAHVVHLEELRLRALELRIRVDMALRKHGELIGELKSLVEVHPFNEWFHGQLIEALNLTGRRREALHAYQKLRVLLLEELGLSPSHELQEIERRVLAS